MNIAQPIRIAMLHAAFKYDDVSHNVVLLEALLRQSLALQPDLIVTPELAVSGYEFNKVIGHDWIRDEVSRIVDRFARLAQRHRVAIVLSTPRFDAQTNQYHNAAILIDEQGQVAGTHDKINVIPGGSESWSTAATAVHPIPWRKYQIGLLICADAYTKANADALVEQGANVLISPAAWSPGLHGPSGEWEQRSRETGLPFYVCNRTGREIEMDFNGSASVTAVAGRRVLEYAEEQPAILSVTVNPDNWLPLSEQFDVLDASQNGRA